MTKIITLNARDTVLFDVTMEHDGLTFAELGADTRQLHERTIDLLASRGVRYNKLRSALVPPTTADDVAFVFDTAKIDAGFYGAEVASHLLPLIDLRWRGSILMGDLIHCDQPLAFALLERGMRLVRDVEIRYTNQLFAVYLSNLTATQRDAIIFGLGSYPAYVGHISARYASPIKDWLSGTLVNRYVKHGTVFIGPHEDDIEDASDRDLGSWPLEEFGYRCVSVPETLHFTPFLSYKIERAVVPGFESDTLHGLATISGDPRPLAEMAVVVDPPKVGYLRTKKAGILGIAGLTEASAADLEELIRAKVNQSYIYELEYRSEYALSQFNIVLEIDVPGRSRPARVVAGLRYEPTANELRLITIT